MALTATVQCTPRINLGVSESISGNGLIAQRVTHTVYDVAPGNLSSTTDIPVSVVSIQPYALAGGTKTIDLYALSTTLGSVDCIGLKVQGLRITNVSGNAALTITGEGANGYSLGGAIVVPAAGASRDLVVTLWFPESLADIATAERYLVITGTGTQAFYLELLLG